MCVVDRHIYFIEFLVQLPFLDENHFISSVLRSIRFRRFECRKRSYTDRNSLRNAQKKMQLDCINNDERKEKKSNRKKKRKTNELE